MSEQKPIVNEEHQDSLIIDENVIEKITSTIARETEGVLDMKGSLMSGFASSFGAASSPTKGITATVDGDSAAVELKIILEYGASAPTIFEKLKTSVREQVYHMTGLHVRDIQLRVVDVMTRAEFDRNKKEDAKKQQPAAPQRPEQF